MTKRSPAARVSPIRIENNPPGFVAAAMPAEAPAPAEEPAAPDDMADDMADDITDEVQDDMPAEEPEITPTPEDTRPHVVVTVIGANVRRGDSTSYMVIGALREGDRAPIKGVSSWNTGWYYIELPSGRSGFIHPNIVRVEGDASGLPAVQPPPLPPTAIPLPTIAPTVVPSGADLIVEGSPVVSPHPATCRQTYRIEVRVKNIGTARSGGGLVEIVDSRHDGAGREVTHAAFRELDPGQSAIATGHITPSVYHSELHHINIMVDSDNRIQEMNENNNRSAAAGYILQKGAC